MSVKRIINASLKDVYKDNEDINSYINDFDIPTKQNSFLIKGGSHHNIITMANTTDVARYKKMEIYYSTRK